jgi:carbonic anhydrase
MRHARPLPADLVDRHRAWRDALGDAERARLASLAADGQRPRALIVACCDSRVMATDAFGGAAGEFFVHRNIANLVPPCMPDGATRSTSATVDYAVTVLGVRHIIVMGHFGCGGVAGCLDMMAGAGGPARDGFVGRWLTILEPGFARVAALGLGREAALRALERQAIIVSLENLMSFPFVADRVAAGDLELHGVWKDIGAGELEVYDAGADAFRPL